MQLEFLFYKHSPDTHLPLQLFLNTCLLILPLAGQLAGVVRVDAGNASYALPLARRMRAVPFLFSGLHLPGCADVRYRHVEIRPTGHLCTCHCIAGFSLVRNLQWRQTNSIHEPTT